MRSFIKGIEYIVALVIVVPIVIIMIIGIITIGIIYKVTSGKRPYFLYGK